MKELTEEQKVERARQNAPSGFTIAIPSSRYDAILEKFNGRREHPGKAERKRRRRAWRVSGALVEKGLLVP